MRWGEEHNIFLSHPEFHLISIQDYMHERSLKKKQQNLEHVMSPLLRVPRTDLYVNAQSATR